MATSVVSPVNSLSESVDSLVTSAGTTGILKGAVGARAVSGGSAQVAAVEVASGVDNAAFTDGTSGVIIAAGILDETAGAALTENDMAAMRIDAKRALVGVIEDATTRGQRAAVTASGSLQAASKTVTVSITPTLDTAIYAAGDSLHTTVLSFANAVGATGGAGWVDKLVVVDKDLQSALGELWLFSATVTPAAANAAHSITDADAALCVGVISFGSYFASALNSVSVAKDLRLPFTVAATTLFGILVTRGTPTYTAAGLVVSLQITQV